MYLLPTSMDPIKLEEHQDMKRHNMCKNNFSSLIPYSLLLVILAVLLSSPLWLPTLCQSVNLFFTQSLPKVVDIVLSPRYLFIVFNLIIIFLVSESRFSGSHLKPDICEEYVTHSQRLKERFSSEGKGNEIASVSSLGGNKKGYESEEEKEEERHLDVEDESGDGKEKNRDDETEEDIEDKSGDEKEEEREELEEEENRGLLTEELNKKVEDFIARVNMQRRLEARMVVCCGCRE